MPPARHLLLAVSCAAVLAVGCKRKDPAPAPAPTPASGPVAAADRPAVLAELRAGAAPREYVFAERGGGVAWAVEEGATSRVFHNGRAGKPYAEVGRVAMSRDGRRHAHAARDGARWRVVVDGSEGPAFAEVGEAVFSPDGAHVAYQAREGDRWRLVVDGAARGDGGAPYAWYAFAGDSSTLLTVRRTGERSGPLAVSDLRSAREVVVDERASTVVLSGDGRAAAAVCEVDGGVRVVTFEIGAPERAARGATYDAVYNPTLGADGRVATYFAERAGDLFAVLGERQERVPPGETPVELPAVSPGNARVAIPIVAEGGVRLREFFGASARVAAVYAGIEGAVYSPDGAILAYVADRAERYFVVVNGREGPAFDRVVDAKFSPDGKRVVYRARQDGKRFVVVADLDGKTVRQHAPYEQVFPVQFTADGKSVAYGVKNGNRLEWKVESL